MVCFGALVLVTESERRLLVLLMVVVDGNCRCSVSPIKMGV